MRKPRIVSRQMPLIDGRRLREELLGRTSLKAEARCIKFMFCHHARRLAGCKQADLFEDSVGREEQPLKVETKDHHCTP